MADADYASCAQLRLCPKIMHMKGHMIAPDDRNENARISQSFGSGAPLLLDIPYTFARERGVLLQKFDGHRVTVALRKNADPAALLEVGRYLAMPFDVDLVDNILFDDLLAKHYAVAGNAVAMSDRLHQRALDDVIGETHNAADGLDGPDDVSTVRLINGIIAEAARQNASDIHLEPSQTGLVVRMRMDGVLQEKLRMPSHVASLIINRIKIMARLDLSERKIPQDGRVSITYDGKHLDVRVSILPNRASERVVLRILDQKNSGFSLDLLGLSDDTHSILTDALAEPNGIILTTGPTGSGKTTTLYAGLKQLNDGNRNILTVEDPIEYAIEGIGQTQVNAQARLSFATGLRALLRQDPDVVMVGEIRDQETADIAVEAARTGHLVLSTIHANDAVGAITRMRDMKVDPFLLASTIRAVIAQRLVLRLCESCREPIQADGSLASLLGFDRGTVVFRERGCDHCDHTGFQGRIGIFEAIRVDDNIRKIINDGGDESRIVAHAFLKSKSISSAARVMVRNGLTTAEEGIRISKREESTS